MPCEVIATCSGLEHQVEVCGHDLWDAAWIRRNPFDQSVLARHVTLRWRDIQSFGNQCINLVSTVLLVQQVKDLIERDVRSGSVVQPRLEGRYDP